MNSVESKNKEILALSTEVTRLKMEVCGISERAESAQKAAIAQTAADHAIKLAAAFKEGIVYGKELFKEMRSVV